MICFLLFVLFLFRCLSFCIILTVVFCIFRCDHLLQQVSTMILFKQSPVHFSSRLIITGGNNLHQKPARCSCSTHKNMEAFVIQLKIDDIFAQLNSVNTLSSPAREAGPKVPPPCLPPRHGIARCVCSINCPRTKRGILVDVQFVIDNIDVPICWR